MDVFTRSGSASPAAFASRSAAFDRLSSALTPRMLKAPVAVGKGLLQGGGLGRKILDRLFEGGDRRLLFFLDRAHPLFELGIRRPLRLEFLGEILPAAGRLASLHRAPDPFERGGDPPLIFLDIAHGPRLSSFSPAACPRIAGVQNLAKS